MGDQGTQPGSLIRGELLGRPCQPSDVIGKSSAKRGTHAVAHHLHIVLLLSRHRPSISGRLPAQYCAGSLRESSGGDKGVLLVSEQAPTPGIISVLRRTARTMIHELLDALDAAGYPDMQSAFHPLFECIDDDGTRLTELAARADMTHQSMSEVVASLEQRGYVERRPDPADGRARLVCLTPAGRKLRRVGTAKIREIEQLWQARWRESGINADVRTAFSSALDSTRR
jgi:DNA-binding MarR family transcriptional regulator